MNIRSCMNGMGCKKKGNWRTLPELGASCFVLGVSIPAPINFMIFSICLKRTDNSFFYICLNYTQLMLRTIIMFRSTLIQNVLVQRTTIESFYNLLRKHSVHKMQATLAKAGALDPDCFFFFFIQVFDCALRPVLCRDHIIRQQFHCRAK